MKKPHLNTAEKSKGIFLMFGGLPSTVIESQVILTSLAMIKEGIDIEIWSFCGTRKTYNEAQRRLPTLSDHGVPISLFRGVGQMLPLSEFINALILGYWLFRYKKKPPFIHCRTEYPTAIAILLKPIIGSKIIWDARGDTESEFRLYIKEMPMVKRLLSPITLLSIKFRLLLSKTFADWCIFVSDSLRSLYIKEDKYNYAVIPCVADKKHFFFSSELREITRNKLRLLPTDVVLIYSGSMTLWQCIDETIKLIKDHLITSDSHKAIILTPDTEKFLSHFSLDFRHKLLCCSVSLIDVNQYLNSADYAIFIRESHKINKVASPVKFAEYSLAGLPIIMTDAVDQAFLYAGDIGNIIQFKFGESLNLPKKLDDTERLEINRKAKLLLSHDKVKKVFYQMHKT